MVAVNDRVKETTTTTGQGTVDLGGAKTGFETFVERIGDGNQTYYCIAAEGGAEFEVGIGTVTNATPDTLSRDTVLSNSDNNTNKVTFGSGTKEVFCTLPASKAVLEDAANNMNVGGSIIVGGTVDGVDIAARDTVLTATATTANAALPKAGGTMTGDIVFDSGQPKGNSGLVPAAGTSGHFLAHNGAFSQVAYANVSGTPSLATVATSGAYGDLSGTPSLATVATSGSYNDLSNTPTIPSNNNQLTNGAGYTTNTGTLTQVTSGGATTVSAGNGIGLNTGNGTITMSGSFSGSFSASSNITAYSSDERLKEFKGTIQQALDKVDQLNGYYYEWNDLAKSLDGGKSFKNGREVGVSAQEIEKVLPEVVTEAPIVKIENLDVDYKTVYYDKIVPLLIEAIKELRAEVKKLKEDS